MYNIRQCKKINKTLKKQNFRILLNTLENPNCREQIKHTRHKRKIFKTYIENIRALYNS